MKLKNNYLLLLAVLVLVFGCSNDEDIVVDETGSLVLKFDNSFGNNDLILDNQTYTTANKEVLKINLARYIVSNVVLIKADGSSYTYPKSKSYFIANEDDVKDGYKFQLTDIPSGDYTKIKFGIGVDKEQWERGASGQGDFLAKAQTADLIWSWSAGYKYFALEGYFTSPTVSTPAQFMIHTGQTGTAYNYTDVTLNLPTKALVKSSIKPEVHIVTDLSKILDGKTVLKLTDYNVNGTGAMIMGGTVLETITANISDMFRVDHVHNE